MVSFKLYMLSLMKDERVGPVEFVLKGVLRVLSWLYFSVVSLIDWVYKHGFRKQYDALTPVISVGNITVGGTGKTPFAIFLADYFLMNGKKPAVLTRGYGNDENKMLEDVLADVLVIKGQDRVKGAYRAGEEGKDVVILDDGFQHRRLKRDLNIVLLDSLNPFGNGHVLPRGVLREPVYALERADIFVLTKADRVGEQVTEETIDKLRSDFKGKAIVTTKYKIHGLTDSMSAVHSAEIISGKRVYLFSGIADPDYFKFLVEKQGADIVLRDDYPDHYVYTQGDIDGIARKCAENNIDNIIVTNKDFVKLKELDISAVRDRLFVLNIVLDIIGGKEELSDRLNSISSGKNS